MRRKTGSVLYVFDFDDTLVKTDSMIRVLHGDGSVSRLTTREYSSYDELSGDTIDYSEFERVVRECDVLDTFDDFEDAVGSVGESNVIVLTARNRSAPPKRWLEGMGYKGVKVYALGSIEPDAKAMWLKRKILSSNYKEVRFFDDNATNVASVDTLNNDRKLRGRVSIVSYTIT